MNIKNINLIESYLEHICVNKNLSKNTIKSYRKICLNFQDLSMEMK